MFYFKKDEIFHSDFYLKIKKGEFEMTISNVLFCYSLSKNISKFTNDILLKLISSHKTE